MIEFDYFSSIPYHNSLLLYFYCLAAHMYVLGKCIVCEFTTVTKHLECLCIYDSQCK